MGEDEGREEQSADMQAKDAEMMERLQQEIRNLPVRDHVVYMMQSLSALAVARMGLEDEARARRDLDQARMAIDAFKALLEIVERGGQAGEMAAHRGVLSQLQLAYVGALNAGTTGDGAGPEGSAAAEGPPAAEREAEPEPALEADDISDRADGP